ncbi:MAG: phosphodiester glycosidase family protein [Clostridia bacterium]|nr:phosphodiester glycosidase family protein [Clostridia bacterium]
MKRRRLPMRGLDSFRRTPSRRYDLPPQEETRAEHAQRFRKRHFDIPAVKPGTDRSLMTLLCAVMLLTMCNASSPMGDVPDVQTRFSQWAQIQNEKTVKILPGPTPEPQSELAQALTFDQQSQQQIIEQAMATPDPSVTPEPTSQFKEYAPGELSYETEKLKVSIEQKKKDDLTYYVCDIKLSDVSQFRTAFAGDDFRSGIYEAVSDIADRYSPVLAINADFCRYHREGVIIRNGEVLRRQNIKKHHLLVVDENGNLSAQTDRSGKQGLVANKLEQQNTWQTFEFGPVLVENGEAADLPLKSFYINCNEGYYEPRTAIGQIGPLHYIVIVVDGRREGYSTGASMPQLQQLFLDEGAQFAFNLDGGGSTTLYFLGEVINMPSGGKQRSVSDVIMFMPNPM